MRLTGRLLLRSEDGGASSIERQKERVRDLADKIKGSEFVQDVASLSYDDSKIRGFLISPSISLSTQVNRSDPHESFQGKPSLLFTDSFVAALLCGFLILSLLAFGKIR